jgi:hypothetical protein
MPALRPVPPEVFRKILEADGFDVINENEATWILAKGVDGFPVCVPKLGRFVNVDVMMGVLNESNIDDATYFRLIESVGFVASEDSFPSDTASPI